MTEQIDEVRVPITITSAGNLRLVIPENTAFVEWTPDQAVQFARSLLIQAQKADPSQPHLFILPYT